MELSAELSARHALDKFRSLESQVQSADIHLAMVQICTVGHCFAYLNATGTIEINDAACT